MVRRSASQRGNLTENIGGQTTISDYRGRGRNGTKTKIVVEDDSSHCARTSNAATDDQAQPQTEDSKYAHWRCYLSLYLASLRTGREGFPR
jgi:hypothetical protein